jgi:hypothetical protein
MLKRQLPHLHDHRYVVVHVLVNVPQKACRNDTHATKRNTGKVHIFVALRICDLTRRNHHLVRGIVASNAWDLLQAIQQTGTGKVDSVQNIRLVRDAEFEHHGATDILDSIWHKFLDKDVVVGRVADGTTDDADGQRKGGDGSDKVVGADDGGHDRGWDDDAANAETCEDQEAPELVEVVDAGDGEGAAAYDGG